MYSLNFYLFPMLVAAASAVALPQQWAPYNMQQQQNLQAQAAQYFLTADQQYQPSEYSNSGYDFASSEGQSNLGGQDHFGGQSSLGDQDHFGGQSSFGGQDHFGGQSSFGGQGHFGGIDLKAHSYPVHQHVDESNPEPIKHYKEVVVPIPQNVEFKVHQPVLIPVPHPVPIHVPVPKAVVIPVIKEVSIPVEKSVPYPVHKIVHVPKIKEVPFEVVKHVIVTVEKPVPFKVPVYETILHTKKGTHKI